jgi:hypothetical protein
MNEQPQVDTTLLPAEPARQALPSVTDVKHAAAQVAKDPEMATAVEDWQEATYLIIGAILHKHGRSAIDLSPRELQKFNETKQVRMTTIAGGGIRYEVRRKKGAK